MRIVRRLWLPLLLSLYGVLVLSMLVGQRGFLQLWTLRQEQRALEAEVFTLLRTNETLRDRIARLQTDDEFLEKIVREELGYVRAGEFVYRFRDSSDPSSP